MNVRRSKSGGYMATCTHRTKGGLVQAAGHAPNRMDAVAKCIEVRNLLIERDSNARAA